MIPSVIEITIMIIIDKFYNNVPFFVIYETHQTHQQDIPFCVWILSLHTHTNSCCPMNIKSKHIYIENCDFLFFVSVIYDDDECSSSSTSLLLLLNQPLFQPNKMKQDREKKNDDAEWYMPIIRMYIDETCQSLMADIDLQKLFSHHVFFFIFRYYYNRCVYFSKNFMDSPKYHFIAQCIYGHQPTNQPNIRNILNDFKCFFFGKSNWVLP